MALIWNFRAGAAGIGQLNQAARASAGGGPWAVGDGCLQMGWGRLEAITDGSRFLVRIDCCSAAAYKKFAGLDR